MAEKQLPPGKRDKKTAPRLFGTRARTGILAAAGVAVFGFVVLPAALGGGSGANAVYVLANAYTPGPEETPAPLLLDAGTPAPLDTPLPTATPGAQISEYSLLQENDDYPFVQTLQNRLMELGYLDSDEPTTVYNAATAVAVSLFQRTVEDDMNGVADSALQEHLFSAEAQPYQIKLGDSGVDVEGMQHRLTELGYYDGKCNGFFGVATEDSLEAFQAKNDLAVDSIFNVDDRDLLFSPSAKPKIDPTPTPTARPARRTTPKPSGGSSSGSGSTSASGSASSGGDSGGSSGGDASYSASYSPSGIISVAKAMLDKPYSWGEESPSKGFDCSGLVYFCLRTCGVSTSRYSASGFSQVGGWANIESPGDLAAGDLVFFKSDSSAGVNHTGIYIGGGRFIHASSSAGRVLTSSIGTAYWTRNFINGRRVF